MDTSSLLGVALVLVLVLANGFFVATEFAIVAVRRSRLEELEAQGAGAARVAMDLVGRLDTYIAACQLGITMASLALGWVCEPAFAHLVEPPLEGLVGHFAPAASHGVAIGTSFALITALHIVLGELAPKGLALQRPEVTSLFVAQPMQIFELLFRWPIASLNGIGNGVLRIFGLEPASGHEMVHSVAELRLLVTGSQQAGVVEESEARIANRAFSFGDLTAASLMTPRTEVDAVPVDMTLPELISLVSSSGHSRLPVYEGSLDNIVGVLFVHDLFRALGTPPEAFDLRKLLRPVVAVPESKPADDLLEEMRTGRQQIAVVIEEYGGTAGIITLEDLLEALVGPIEEEATNGRPPRPSAQPQPDGSIIFDGLTRLDEWEEETGVRLDAADHDAAETLGGLVMARLGRIPAVGDEVGITGRTLRVEELDGKRVAAVRLLPDSG
ncbi:MAG TPA: hemolysin family protein [Chloroflexota bacterium]|nr:hemolysin family protein [Chloroflexota bacterium]